MSSEPDDDTGRCLGTLGSEDLSQMVDLLLDVTCESWSYLSHHPGSQQSGHPWTRDPLACPCTAKQCVSGHDV